MYFFAYSFSFYSLLCERIFFASLQMDVFILVIYINVSNTVLLYCFIKNLHSRFYPVSYYKSILATFFFTCNEFVCLYI